ncbi:glycosyltransferase family 4 protein [Chondrinema litorale]|uniref:glycosyltransferase family 4 protein n=1 Tax=Chondrinema litorale TaxID=2994555 RepID=UPI0025439D5B|nr:glycosyltransferase family 4 protein [Chondrinema litorale]UZR94356.1 glycosyltransferase family 4 protein [Chondrinema litorale]
MLNYKIAIVHEWLVDHSGSEKVLEEILNVFPNSDLFAVVEFLPENLKYFVKSKKVTTSFIQKLPFAKKRYRNYLPLMPFAIEQLDVSKYDIVISNSHAVAKGVITNSNQIHICYCHSPIRYAWDLYHSYLKDAGLTNNLKGILAKIILHYIRIWDLSTINRVDYFIANSSYIAQRIYKVYKRDSVVIYPPVNTSDFELNTYKSEYYLTASRMVSYKKIDVIVEAFNRMPEKKLVVIGDGPEFNKIKRIAKDNIDLLGYQEFSVLKERMEKAKAFIFAADEDFGIMPVEAQACGTPVIYFSKGGAKETVIENVTGIPFYLQKPEAIIDSVISFEKKSNEFNSNDIHKHAKSFDKERFKVELKEFIVQKVEERFV